jgi:hypothetical protein
MRVGYDLHNVLVDANQTYFNGFREAGYLLDKKPDELTHHFVELSWPEENVPPDLHLVFSKEPGFWRTMPVLPAPVESIRACFLRNRIVHIVTDTPDYGHAEVEQLLVDNHIPHDYLAFERASKKAEYCRKHEIDVFIEDRADTALQIAEAGTLCLLVPTSYNKPELPHVAPCLKHPLVKRLDKIEDLLLWP